MDLSPAAHSVSMADRRKRLARARRLSRRAELLADAGRVEEAIHYQSQAAELRPDDPSAFFRLGLLHREARHMGPAVDALRRALHLSPGERDPREILIKILLESSLFHEAISEGKALVRLAARSLFARDALCAAYLQTGQMDKAIQTTSEMILLDPLSPVHHYKRAVLLQQQGDTKAAIGEFTRTQELADAESELFADAGDAMRAMDEAQAHQIVLLASEDFLFRTKLRHDTAEAVEERGFFLSEEGIMRLHMLVQHHFLDSRSAPTLAAWGGVQHYN